MHTTENKRRTQKNSPVQLEAITNKSTNQWWRHLDSQKASPKQHIQEGSSAQNIIVLGLTNMIRSRIHIREGPIASSMLGCHHWQVQPLKVGPWDFTPENWDIELNEYRQERGSLPGNALTLHHLPKTPLQNTNRLTYILLLIWCKYSLESLLVSTRAYEIEPPTSRGYPIFFTTAMIPQQHLENHGNRDAKADP
jgi:hypothetical protein